MEINKLEPGLPNKVNVLITSEKDSKDFCEYDEQSETFLLIRILSITFPGFYGIIPRTHHVDGEPLDVLILTNEPLKQGIVVQARPIGLIRLRGKVPDDILITVLVTDRAFEKTQDLLSLNKEELDKLKNFLEELKEKETEQVLGSAHAKKSVERAIELYKEEFE